MVALYLWGQGRISGKELIKGFLKAFITLEVLYILISVYQINV